MASRLTGAPCAAFALVLLLGCGDDGSGEDQVVAEEPNEGIPYLGVDGEFTSDPLAVDCPDDPRNPGRVALKQQREMSFFSDREGKTPLAEGCAYSYEGFAPDPHYFPEYPDSVWLQFALTAGGDGCESFHFVIMRPPHGDDAVKHMHLRYGDVQSSFVDLLDMSKGDEQDADKCNPWWSVYCSAGSEGCGG
ncbi:uncharacterized protein SOCE26_026780 [Sorangium cellulosum]|uniref:Uncharacterized protein n=1 Tax=Sorangium cellulosum TaxID=56 RepID=A0A2L0EPP0_SORCE|nr:hypothetical protein [Sorangium cellulosum]AUX41268.1 uncharacterized protein SOCE26_026780 [Sorangium cellulosum]